MGDTTKDDTKKGDDTTKDDTKKGDDTTKDDTEKGYDNTKGDDKKGDDSKKDDDTTKGDDKKGDDSKKDDDTKKPVKTKHMPVPKDGRTPAKAAEIATIQDNGSLQLNFAGDPRASQYYGKKGLTPTLIVEKKLFPKKNSSKYFEASQLPAKVFPLFNDGTLKFSPDGKGLFSDAEYWVGDNKIFQHFHFGFKDSAGEN